MGSVLVGLHISMVPWAFCRSFLRHFLRHFLFTLELCVIKKHTHRERTHRIATTYFLAQLHVVVAAAGIVPRRTLLPVCRRPSAPLVCHTESAVHSTGQSERWAEQQRECEPVRRRQAPLSLAAVAAVGSLALPSALVWERHLPV